MYSVTDLAAALVLAVLAGLSRVLSWAWPSGTALVSPHVAKALRERCLQLALRLPTGDAAPPLARQAATGAECLGGSAGGSALPLLTECPLGVCLPTTRH